MANRVDLIVLGATGYTGTNAVKKLGTLVQETEYETVTWGIAGRSRKKLNNLLTELKNNGALIIFV